MFKKSKICTAALLALSSSFAMHAFAQEQLEKVEITGSAIKRIQSEGALPVTTLTQADIQKTGATSVTELIQALPSMQGFTTSSMSVNGGGGGQTSAALHSLNQKYTLVLLDGHRFAPFGGDGSANLSSIPLGAVERVEVLTDGASALYGSDAIAGVVNFILKKDKTDGDIELERSIPQKDGGKSTKFGVTKGFGTLDKEGFNILMTFSHEQQDKLQASQRSFSAAGANFGFSSGGQNYWFSQSTGNTEPANISVAGNTINPYYNKNGNCGTSFAYFIPGEGCRFNYAATVQDIPASQTDGGMLNFRAKVNDDTTFYVDLSMSRAKMTAQYAPPAQPMGLSTTKLPTLWNNYVVPYLTANGLSATNATLDERVVGSGGRTDDYITDNRHIVFGLEGLAAGWDYSASLVLSNNKIADNAAGGYLDFTQFSSLVAQGLYDPVMPIAGQSAVLQPATLSSNFSKTYINMNQLSIRGSRELFKMPAGMSSVAVGADYSQLHFITDYSQLMMSGNGTSTQPASSDYPVGGNYGQVPFDAGRTNYGVFGELELPLAHKLDATVAGRYDAYSKVHNKDVFDPSSGNLIAPADQGNTFNSSTYKLSLRYQPVDQLLLRGSYGTGFKAPNVPDIANYLSYAGSSQTFACPFKGTPVCNNLPSGQYDLVAGGNPIAGSNGLKPETSKQWTLGFRVDPMKGLSMGMDLWNISMNNQIISSGIPQAIAFANPTQYASLFINPYTDPAAGYQTLAYIQSPFNLGQSQYQGLDWDLAFRHNTDLGELTAQLSGTQMLKQQYQLTPGGAWNTDLGQFGPDQQVVFRTQIHLITSLKTGAFLNTLAMHYKSGYRDESFGASAQAIFSVGANGQPLYANGAVAFAGLNVPAYYTFDWQTRYTFNKALQFTAGIKNLFDKNPPLSLQNGGGGNQAGYDGRYADPLGRTFYLSGAYKF